MNLDIKLFSNFKQEGDIQIVELGIMNNFFTGCKKYEKLGDFQSQYMVVVKDGL